MRRHRPNADINVLLIDDHTVAREGYRRLLSRDSKLKLLGEPDERAPELQLKAQAPPPDVIAVGAELRTEGFSAGSFGR